MNRLRGENIMKLAAIYQKNGYGKSSINYKETG